MGLACQYQSSPATMRPSREKRKISRLNNGFGTVAGDGDAVDTNFLACLTVVLYRIDNTVKADRRFPISGTQRHYGDAF